MARMGVIVLLLACFVGVAAAPGAGAAAPKAAVPKAAAPAPAAPAAPAAKPAAPGAAAATDLEKAVAAMRRVKPSDFSEDQQKAKAKELDEAWKTLIQAGPAGAARLKQELAKIDAAKEKDDCFKLGASVVLWQIGGLDEAPTIAQVWSGDVALDLNYNYVFPLAMEAARTQDPRALPMLVACLKDKKGQFFVATHVMTLDWPLTAKFVWAAYGPKGLPALAGLLESSQDGPTREFAAMWLADCQYLPALPTIRKIAREGRGAARQGAIRALGVYGHPEDYTFLVEGLKSKDPREACEFAYAIYEYEDLRAAAHLIPLLDSDDGKLRLEVVAGLVYFKTPETIEAFHRYSTAAKAAEVRDWAAKCVAALLKATNLTWDQYAAKPREEKERLLAPLRLAKEGKYNLKQGDRTLTHEELLKAAEEWIKNGRITGGTYEWVEDRHTLAASTPADIDLWLEVKAKVCLRVSDECLPEMQIIDGLVQRLGRSRYRKVVGICDKVEPAGAAVPAPAAKTPAKAPPD
jgi:hypothetical protein